MMADAAKMYLSFFKKPFFLNAMKKVAEHVYTPVTTLKCEFSLSAEPVEYSDRLSLKYKPLAVGQVWSKKKFDCAWFHFTGRVGVEKTNLAGIFRFGGEGAVYDDTGVLQGITAVMAVGDLRQPVPGKQVIEGANLNIDSAGKADIWIDAGHNTPGFAKLEAAEIVRVREDVKALYYDMLILGQYCAFAPRAESKKIEKSIVEAIKKAGNFSVKEVAQARGVLSVFYTGKNDYPFEIFAVGHAHLDLAWRWPIRETKRKGERTFSNALVNIAKKDGYIFGASQPQLFDWMKTNRPALYEKIKQAVFDGRIEPQGAMWCEPDTNMPCGESLIRQCYYGKKFFRDEFGKELNYLWVPDVFGYSASLPRILRGSGVDKLMTIKLSWNNINKFPYHSFNWKGIGDGTLLVHMPPEGDYNSQTNPYETKKIADSHRERAISPLALMPFGCGDGGGGPGEYHVNSIERQSKMSVSSLPRIHFGSAKDFFTRLEQYRDILPSYTGELYFEKHQGTYTTQGRMKRDMRDAEMRLHNTEFISTLASLKGFEYPHEKLDEIWKCVLLHQFHDILPGSSITRVYDEAAVTFAEIRAKLDAIDNEALRVIKGNGINVLNTSPFARDGYVMTDNGWCRYSAGAYAVCEAVPFIGEKLRYGDTIIENDLVRVEFNSDGEITALVDKATGENAVKSTFNTMRIYTDKKMIPYDAWDIDIKYTNKYSQKMKLVQSKVYSDGVAAVREQKFVHGRSVLLQKIYVVRDNPCVFVENEVDWHESHRMLRADFYPAHYSDTVNCDIQMGYLGRSTGTDNSINYAQFEICAHKWVDVSDENGGFALMNHCKYGHRVKNGLVSLNLLRSPTYPDKKADRHEHSFTYAMYAHKGGVAESELIRYAYELNYPVKTVEAALTDSFVSVSDTAVVIETVMKTENGEIAVRLYESTGKPAMVKLTPGFGYTGCCESNLLFESRRECDISALSFGEFEIKTILFTL